MLTRIHKLCSKKFTQNPKKYPNFYVSRISRVHTICSKKFTQNPKKYPNFYVLVFLVYIRYAVKFWVCFGAQGAKTYPKDPRQVFGSFLAKGLMLKIMLISDTCLRWEYIYKLLTVNGSHRRSGRRRSFLAPLPPLGASLYLVMITWLTLYGAIWRDKTVSKISWEFLIIIYKMMNFFCKIINFLLYNQIRY